MRVTFLCFFVMLLFASCTKPDVNPLSDNAGSVGGTEGPGGALDLYLPYIGTWQAITFQLMGHDSISGDTAINLFLKRATPSDLRTYGTKKWGTNFSTATAFTSGTILWDINFDVIPNQLVLTELPDNRLWRFYDIIQFEEDTLILQNQERYEYWCRY